MIQTPESEKTMSSTTPSSLASVAHAKVERSTPTSAQCTGLEARGIHAWFGKNHVLSNINLDFAAGDVTTVPYKQIVIAAGEGAKAALGAFDYLIRTPNTVAVEELSLS